MDDRLYIDSIEAARQMDGYENLLFGIRQSFMQAVKEEAAPLFTTDAAEL